LPAFGHVATLRPSQVRRLGVDWPNWQRLRLGIIHANALHSRYGLTTPATIRGRTKVSIVDDREVNAVDELEVAAEVVPMTVTVRFEDIKPRTFLEKVGERIRRCIDAVRRRGAMSAITTATSVRDAVRDEVQALSRNDRIEAVWVVVGEAVDGYFIVRIPVVQPWEG
jgi:hypothetical protein